MLAVRDRSSDALRILLQGTAVYVPEKEALVWKIKSFPGGREFLLRAKFSLPSVAAEEEPRGRMPPMRVDFEIPYFTVSGIQVFRSDQIRSDQITIHLLQPHQSDQMLGPPLPPIRACCAAFALCPSAALLCHCASIERIHVFARLPALPHK